MDSSELGISEQSATEIQVASQNPWENSPFGSLSGKAPMETAAVPHTLIPIEERVEPSPSQAAATPTDSTEKPLWQKLQERAEAMTEAKLSIRFDREGIAGILRDNPDLLPPGFYFGDWRSGERDHNAEVQRTLDAISRLPESLDFQPGITLIIGDNGLGKSTLARAIQLSATIQQIIDDEELSPSKAKDFVLDPVGYDRTSPIINSPAKYIAPLIHVQELQSGMSPRYTDLSTIMGAKTAIANEVYDKERNSLYGNGQRMGLRNGGSHRQTVDTIFREFRRDKMSRHPERSAPRLYFIDEPEVGMSPRRHRGLAQEMLDVTNEGSILMIPTNSIVLVDSDLPRIDLEYPERGIHRPSQYANTPEIPDSQVATVVETPVPITSPVLTQPQGI